MLLSSKNSHIKSFFTIFMMLAQLNIYLGITEPFNICHSFHPAHIIAGK